MKKISSKQLCISRAQTLRFLGCYQTPSERELSLIDSCEKELAPLLTYSAVYEKFDISHHNGFIDLSFQKTESKALAKCLENCEKIYLFASTAGIATDKLIKKYSGLDEARAACMQAIGASAEECWCEEINAILIKEANADGFITTPRFSPGYGDLPLSFQKDVFNALNVQKHLGITLTEGGLMLPTKSVTAIIGLKRPL